MIMGFNGDSCSAFSFQIDCCLSSVLTVENHVKVHLPFFILIVSVQVCMTPVS